MVLLKDELTINKIEEILSIRLRIPDYQRPYTWNKQSANTLFNDVVNAYSSRLPEYRIGSVILHKKDEDYFIVDGQQRLTTLAILLYCLNHSSDLLNEKYSVLSYAAITQNFQLFSQKTNDLSDDEKNKLKDYILVQCTIVKVVTDNEQEAFQFFDSQNSRGRGLNPHDLLKSYHLREMTNEEENTKVKIIQTWEQRDSIQLAKLFKDNLFPLTQWYKGRTGLHYNVDKINQFKGITGDTEYNYAIYHKGSQLFVEQLNSNKILEFFGKETVNQYQLTQPLIAGKRFFLYTEHYLNLLEFVQQTISLEHDSEELPETGAGDKYIKQLYENALVFIIDRFGRDSLTKEVMRKMYMWSYSLRLVMQNVYIETVNAYARGKHERINYEVDVFTIISEMQSPAELDLLILDILDVDEIRVNREKYKSVIDYLKENGGIQS